MTRGALLLKECTERHASHAVIPFVEPIRFQAAVPNPRPHRTRPSSDQRSHLRDGQIPQRIISGVYLQQRPQDRYR